MTWTTDGDEDEVALLGGDVTEGVVRVGSTVRRPRSPMSPAVEAVLGHLERAGFPGAPRFLGRDDRGRDVLTYVEGEVAGRPWPAWTAHEHRGASVARLLRRYHDAVAPLGVPAWSAALPVPTPDGIPASIAGAPTLLGHRDITPENVVFRDGLAAALIDFDQLRPATREEDLVNLLLWWAAWMHPEDREPAMRGVDPPTRARVLLDAYGCDDDARRTLTPLAIDVADRAWHQMRWRAEHLGGGWARMWEEGVGQRILRRQDWLQANRAALHAAIVG